MQMNTANDYPHHVKIVEVSPRDGLQNERMTVPTDIKIEYINRLTQTGLTVVEATSFVSPKWVPQLADGARVVQGIHHQPGVIYPCLVPNARGLEEALACGVKDIAVFITPSETFSQKNTHCSVAESLTRVREVLRLGLAAGVRVRGYISCVLGCPYEGEVAIDGVVKQAQWLIDNGCYEISLGDTIGVGTPLKTKALLQAVRAIVPVDQIAVHFHDTYGQALANLLMALQMGVHVVDASAGGLGGCPYARGAAGNVATEDVLYMLAGMNIETGVDLAAVVAASFYMLDILGKPPLSKVGKVMFEQSRHVEEERRR